MSRGRDGKKKPLEIVERRLKKTGIRSRSLRRGMPLQRCGCTTVRAPRRAAALVVQRHVSGCSITLKCSNRACHGRIEVAITALFDRAFR
jgi:hypothetical protein